MKRLALMLLLLVACGGPSSSGTNAGDAHTTTAAGSENATLDREMAVMRAHDQHVWNETAQPAMTAAQDVFAKVDFVGKTQPELTAMIGAPMKVEGDVAQYYFHNGEAGVVRWFHFDHGRVARVQTVMTQ